MRYLASVLLLVIGVTTAHAQSSLPVPSEPSEWGEVSPEVLRAKDYPADSNASAVILSDYGSGFFKRNGEIQVDYHTRVKILDEEGYDSGTGTIPYYGGDRTQQVKNVEGVTYTLNDEGAVQRHELEDDDIFEEDVDGESRMACEDPATRPVQGVSDVPPQRCEGRRSAGGSR